MAMRKVFVADFGNDPDITETQNGGLVHYDQAPIIGSGTLCGHTDRTKWTFKETTRRVNCPGCLGVQKHVLGR